MNVQLKCEQCGKDFLRAVKDTNRQDRVFCSIRCSGNSRRICATPEQEKIRRSEYQKQYRIERHEIIQARRKQVVAREAAQESLWIGSPI